MAKLTQLFSNRFKLKNDTDSDGSQVDKLSSEQSMRDEVYESQHKRLDTFRREGFHEIEGWCSERLFDVVDLLCKTEINKSGGCLEIGVHHGKFYILLNQAISSNEQSYAIDIFDDQYLNVDQSGAGSLAAFKSNLKNFDVHQGSNTKIISGDSTDSGLGLDEIIGLGSMRFISIDGGHTAQHTINDLKLANKLVANQGVVILDDITHQHWLGVIEGVCSFLNTTPTLVPFAIGLNKLFLCKFSFQRYYFELFSNSSLKSKDVKFFGFDIVALE